MSSTGDQPSTANVRAASQTPQMQSQPLPQQANASPSQASPADKTTPTKSAVKALPTVRDHTTDQLDENGDEFIPKEFDDAGETKVDADGYPLGGREYKCRTFKVPLRGNKLFMLATECARVLGYRDSYLLFNKNRSLHKIIAAQIEKDDLIQQDILPYSYRSRQIAIVSARSMFRQFGSRVIVNGRRVRDDYWESKARKQGFTEEDLAGEKRPGAAKARDAAAAEAASSASLLPALSHNDVIYSDALGAMPHGLSLGPPSSVSPGPLPMINMATTTDDPRLKEYSSIAHSHQELAGQPYQDRSQPSSAAEILNQASHTVDFNKLLGSQRGLRQKGLEEFYSKPRDIPASQPPAVESNPPMSQPLQSPQMPSGGMMNTAHGQGMLPQQPMMPGQPNYPAQMHPGQVAQSPVRGMPQAIRPDLMHHRPSNAALSGATHAPPYGYSSQPQQIWGQPPSQPHASPMPVSGAQALGMSQYAAQLHAQQQQVPSPLAHAVQNHPSQSPRNQARPFPMQHPQAQQQQPMGGLGFPGGTTAPYPAMAAARAMSQGGQPFVAGTPQQTGMPMGMGAGGGMPGWPQTPGGQMQQGAPQSGQSGTPLGGWSGY